MPRLIAAFLRHGDYDQLQDVPSALQPFALTEAGKEQARQGAKVIQAHCQQQSWTAHTVIDSSTLLRAWQTASEIKTYLEMNTSQTFSIDSHEDLCERSVGSVANLSIRQIEAILKEDPRFELPPKNWKSDSHYSLPFTGAESLLNSGQRVAQHINQCLSLIQAQITQDTLKVFVGHGASFRHAAYHLRILKFEQISQLSMFHAQPIFFEFLGNQSYCHIAGDWKVRTKEEDYSD